MVLLSSVLASDATLGYEATLGERWPLVQLCTCALRRGRLHLQR